MPWVTVDRPLFAQGIAVLKVMLGAESPMVRERGFLERTGIDGDWKIGEGAAGELLTWASIFHDLVVVEQTDMVADEIGFDVAEQSALASGRPTLVVPYRGHFPTVGKRILVAWNGSREAARAVHGALPFIAKAERVDLLLGRGKETFSSIGALSRLQGRGLSPAPRSVRRGTAL